MRKKTVWVNTIVNNEENFLWFAVMSIVDYVDKVLVWDTGSTDKTVKIIRKIREIRKDKIDFKEVGPVDKLEFPKVRQKMLDESKCEWIVILDGDEIWWKDSIKKLTEVIDEKGDQLDGIVVPMVVPVGDIYHVQEAKAGRYEILGKKGHLSMRAFNKAIPGLHVDQPYGMEGFFDKDNVPIQRRNNLAFLDAPFLHVSHLPRSSRRRRFNKFKHEIGNLIPKNFKFPEVFYKLYPSYIASPWQKLTGLRLVKAKLLTPLRKIKRRLV